LRNPDLIVGVFCYLVKYKALSLIRLFSKPLFLTPFFTAYIDTNFDNTGLGILLMDGWAICNGQNGTPPMAGLVSIGYGGAYSVIGAFGGSKDAVVVEHTHTFEGSEDNTPKPGNMICENSVGSTGIQSSLSTVGVSGVNKNMQPYIVLLKIMKL